MPSVKRYNVCACGKRKPSWHILCGNCYATRDYLRGKPSGGWKVYPYIALYPMHRVDN